MGRAERGGGMSGCRWMNEGIGVKKFYEFKNSAQETCQSWINCSASVDYFTNVVFAFRSMEIDLI